MKILLIDAYDSFVYIIYQYLLSLDLEVDVIRSDKILPDVIKYNKYDLIFLGPGPGHPNDSGYVNIIKYSQEIKPIFGICLGMQAIIIAYNGYVVKSDNIMHGKSSYITHNNSDCFASLTNPLRVTRYHSLVANKNDFPYNDLEVIAYSNDDNNIMAVKHKRLPILGVQFHPESITTVNGIDIFRKAIMILSAH